jgi:maltoporin
MDDDEEIRLRDKFAIEILGSLLGKETYNDEVANFITYHSSNDNPHTKSNSYKRMEHTIRAAYKIADIMRKVRLTSFE